MNRSWTVEHHSSEGRELVSLQEPSKKLDTEEEKNESSAVAKPEDDDDDNNEDNALSGDLPVSVPLSDG